MSGKAEKRNQSRIWTVLAGIGLFIANKLKWVFGLLKLGKFATLISMFLSIGAYAIFYGWKFAFAIVYLIFVHEMGHLIAAKIKGLKTSPAIFIPFMGAAIGLKELPKNAKDEAFVAYAGPLFGLFSFLPAVFLYESTGGPFWGLVIFLGAMINLFNLFPVSPLDGGRIVGVLSTKLWFIGLCIIVPYLFISPDPIMFLIFLFGIMTWWRRLREDYELKKNEQMIKLFEDEVQKLDSIKGEMAEYRDMPNFGYIIGTYIEDVRVARERLDRNIPRGYAVPFFQDKKKLKRHYLEMELQVLRNRGRFLNSLKNDYEAYQVKKEELLKIEELQQPEMDQIVPELPIFDHNDYFNEYKRMIDIEIEKTKKTYDQMKNYYVASLKTKITVLLLYLLLAGILSVFAVYGNHIMDVNRHLIM